MDITKLIRNIEKYLLVIFAGLFAIFVLPKFSSAFAVPKEIFGAVVVSLVLILWSVRSVIKGETSFYIGKFDLGVLLVALAYILSAVIKTPNKMEAFFYPGTVTFVIISCLSYFLINQAGTKTKNQILLAIFGSGVLLSISILFTQLGLFSKIPQLPTFMKSSSFNPIGGFLPSVLYLIAILPIGISSLVKEKDLAKKMFYGVASVFIVFGATVLVANLLPGKPQSAIFPSMQTSWEITVESLKTSPIWGVGPDNYVSAFNLFKPIAYNQTNLWAARFSTAGNYYFTLITEVGFVGLGTFALLVLGIYRVVIAEIKAKRWEVLTIAFLVIVFAFFPSAPTLFFLLMISLSVFSKSEEKSISLSTNRVPSAIIAAPILLGVIALGVFGTKAVVAEVNYKKSLDALSNNDGITTYNLMTLASSQNPYVDRYHISLSQVDMALATSIASNKNLSDTDRSNITQLISQAIDEGKAAVSLNLGRSQNWELLAQIYGSIMPFAQGADQFAIQTYTQAIALDPLNPNLRISLGGIYYALGRYDDAIDTFKLAVLAKSDLANAHYNLAIAYREKKDYADAITEMNNVLSLVDKNSSDYTLAESTLTDLQKNNAAVTPAATTTESLTTPQKQTAVIKPPLTLPQEATPPASQ